MRNPAYMWAVCEVVPPCEVCTGYLIQHVRAVSRLINLAHDCAFHRALVKHYG